jgi:undecaprenyl-diphosphatase
VPAAVAGLALQDVVEQRLGTTRGIAAGLVLGGAALWWADTRTSSRDHGKPGDAIATARFPGSPGWDAAGALVVPALAQVVALVPGVSRQGAVLTALRARGVERAEAARTSLLMSIPVTLGASGLTAVRARALPPLVPALAAAATAYAATRRARWTGNATKAAVVVRMGMAAAAVATDRRRT